MALRSRDCYLIAKPTGHTVGLHLASEAETRHQVESKCKPASILEMNSKHKNISTLQLFHLAFSEDLFMAQTVRAVQRMSGKGCI